METKNICGKIPVELHEKVRQELEETDLTIPEFLTQVIKEHFESKGVEKMAARTLAVQVSEELFTRFKERYEKEKRQRPGRFSQKDYLVEIITQALDAADEEELEEKAEEPADEADPGTDNREETDMEYETGDDPGEQVTA